MALRSEKMIDMIFFNSLKFDLLCKMWFILENVLCELEKKVYSSAFSWKVLKITIKSIFPNVSFKVSVSLLIFCFVDLSIRRKWVGKVPTIIMLLSISHFMSVSICLRHWGAPMLGAWILSIVMSFPWFILWSLRSVLTYLL